MTAARAMKVNRCPSAPTLLLRARTPSREGFMGRILLGVVIGVILVIWLLASCVSAIF
jgi:hypothetical protein